jgi:DNA polymerase/3'-5' exonuclease PolX
MGLSWNPYYGVFEQGKCIACETEEEIFRVLGLDYINPEKRER